MEIPKNWRAAVTSGLSIIVLVSILAFIFVQFWYFFQESENTKKVIQEIGQTYDSRIKQLVGTSGKIKISNKQEVVKLSFLKEFKSQQIYEWSHERVNRRYTTMISIGEWFVILFILFLAVWNESVSNSSGSDDFALKRAAALLIPFFAALAIALPAASQKLGYDARQQLHDFRAQQLGFLIVEVEAGVTEPQRA